MKKCRLSCALVLIALGGTACSDFKARTYSQNSVSAAAGALSFNRSSIPEFSSGTLSLQGQCLDGILIRIQVQDSPEATAVCDRGAFTFGVSLGGADGLKQIQIFQTDHEGKITADSVSVTKDTVAPLVDIMNIVRPVGETFYVVSGICEAGGGELSFGGDMLSTSPAECSANGTFQVSATVTPGEGMKDFEVMQLDRAGNRGRKGKKHLVDMTAPVVTITIPVANAQIKDTFQLMGTCETGLSVNAGGTGLMAALSQMCVNGSFSFAAQLSAGDGFKEILVSQTDAALNKTEVKLSVIKDSAAPALMIVMPLANATVGASMTVSGTCESGLNVMLSGTALAQPVTAACANSVFSANVNVSAGDGAKVLMASIRDAAGNETTASVSVVRDSSGPNLTVTSPAANSFAQASVAAAGTCETGLPVMAGGTGLAQASNLACNGGMFQGSLALSAGEGLKSISFSQVDGAGNRTEVLRQVTKDTVPPAVQVAQPLEGAVLTSDNVTVSGNCESGLPVRLQGAGLAAQSQASCANSAFTTTVVLSASNGTKVIEVSQVDQAGNSASVSRSVTKNVAGTVPVIISQPAANSYNQGNITLQGSCNTGSTVVISGAVSASQNVTCAGGLFSQAIALSAGDGLKTVNVAQTVSGVTSMDSRSFNKDTVAPVVRISLPAANASAASGVTLSGTCESGLQVNISGTGVDAPSSAACANGAFSAAISFSAGDGSKLVQVSQTDAAGNNGSDSRSFIRDSAGPALTINQPAANFPAPASISLQGSCEGTSPVQISGTGAAAMSSAACTNGAFQSAVNFSAGDGVKQIVVSQADAAGNTTTVTRSFVRDSVAPAVTIAQPAAGTAASAGVTISGACESGLQVSISGAGVASATSVACNNAAYSSAIVFSAGEGTKSVTVAQTDAAGNVGSVTRGFVRDSVRPNVTIAQPAANAVVGASVAVSGACESGISVVLYGAGVTQNVSATCSNGAYTGTVALTAGDGAKEIRAGQTDAAQNAGVAIVQVVRDGTAPVIRITAPLAGTFAPTGLTVQGTCETGLLVTASGTGLASMAQANCVAGAFSVNVIFSANDGTKNVVVRQTDAAGNSGQDARDFVKGDLVTIGANLYASHCATCHGPLASSTKLNRTAAQIETARTSIGAMSNNPGIAALTTQQIEAIAAALKTNTPMDLANPFTCNTGSDPAVAVLKRLTNREYTNTLADLLGANVTLTDYQMQLSALPREAVVDHPAVRLFDTTNPTAMNLLLVRAYNDIAARIADVITASTTKMNNIAGNSCISGATVTDACVMILLDNFGLKAYRRPLTAAEKTLYLTLYRTGASPADSMARVVQALLSSPPFLYHLYDNGTLVSGRTDLLQFSPYEVAQKLSYMILGSMPDAELFTAAANGGLATAAGVQAQVDRLFALGRARDSVRSFYSQWLRLDKVPVMTVTTAFANGVDPALFQAEAQQEIVDFMDHTIWTQRGNYQALLTSNLIFPKGPNLARVYGVTASSQPVASSDPNRKGLLTRAGVLAMSPSGGSDPIKRGVRVRFHVLCDNLGAPPANAIDLAATADPLTSTRTQTEVKTSPSLCVSCHAQINPFGFSFENFDAFGRFRLQETVTHNGQSATWPIDAKVVPNIVSTSEAVTDGAAQLQEAMLKYSKAPACFAKQWLQYNMGRSSVPEDSCSLQPMYDSLMRSGGSMQDMFKSLSQTPSFKLKKIN